MIRAKQHHLQEADESYFEHLQVATSISLGLAKASVACGIHALIPGLSTRTASRSLTAVQTRLAARSALAAHRRETTQSSYVNAERPEPDTIARAIPGIRMILLASIFLWSLIITSAVWLI